MMLVLNDYIIVANAFYAKKTDFLEYSDIEIYKVLLYKMLNEKYKYIMFGHAESTVLEIANNILIKEENGIRCFNKFEEEDIKSLNSMYSDDVQEIIKLSREVYIEKSKQLRKK